MNLHSIEWPVFDDKKSPRNHGILEVPYLFYEPIVISHIKWLVGGDWNMATWLDYDFPETLELMDYSGLMDLFMDFNGWLHDILGIIIIPTDERIFFTGVQSTNQIYIH